MSEIVCELKQIYKEYQGKRVLNQIDLQLQQGEIYGFIGKNGAGKTTTMRIIVGLSFPTRGDVYLDGSKEKHMLTENRKKIGCLIENPALYTGMSAFENLEAVRILYGIEDKNCVNQVLKLIGLEDTGKKSVKNFSLGMRQRLGIGMALINRPKLLILDEPINGLDPNGIVQIRDLIKKIKKEYGTTILISSHILSEMYQTVDHYIFIDKGTILEKMDQEELNKKCQKYILIHTDQKENVIEYIRSQFHTEKFQIMDDSSIRMYDYTDDFMNVLQRFQQDKIDLKDISVREDSLEEYFLKRTSYPEVIL